MRLQQYTGLPLSWLWRHLTFKNLVVEGRIHYDPDKPTLFISNHDCIIREGTILNSIRREQGLPNATLIAGENLSEKWYVRALLGFEQVKWVPRGPGSGLALTQLIKDELDQGIATWVAQGRGRSKDGHHETITLLLENLVAVYGSAQALFDSVVIQPYVMSVQYDPAAPLLATTGNNRPRTKEELEKARRKEGRAIAKAIYGWKGEAKAVFCRPITDVLEPRELRLALDMAIQGNYPVFDTHREAFENRAQFAEDKWREAYVVSEQFLNPRFRKQLERIPQEHRAAFVARYAIPVAERQALSPSRPSLF